MIEPLVKARIRNLAGGRVFPGVAPAGTKPPYVTYTRVSGSRDWTLAGPSGALVAAVQVNAWAATPKEAAEIMEAAFALLSPAGDDFACTGADDVPAVDDELTTKLHGAALEFSFIR
ncbi:tail completion protein gp17 [Achromobacter xylosoxidans]|uniref:tail completion protein gp17 n=1 Tax=Alcaligenes xylosoxydans xylosoxydans TaxID=85698 RepID=UPI0012DF37D4|nr:DUF3168 domain-containing protein [Achromobacter xylosoxidans]